MSREDLQIIRDLLASGTCNSLQPPNREMWKKLRDQQVAKLEEEIGRL